jgi:hypothetical protein
MEKQMKTMQSVAGKANASILRNLLHYDDKIMCNNSEVSIILSNATVAPEPYLSFAGIKSSTPTADFPATFF